MLSSLIWIVGSQQGCMGGLDDCIIHGVYPDKQSAIQCIIDLQRDAPSDVFGLIPLPLGSNVHVGFSVNPDWRWYQPLDGSSGDEDGGGDSEAAWAQRVFSGSDSEAFGCSSCSGGSSMASDASMVRVVEQRQQKAHMTLLHRGARLSAPCNLAA